MAGSVNVRLPGSGFVTVSLNTHKQPESHTFPHKVGLGSEPSLSSFFWGSLGPCSCRGGPSGPIQTTWPAHEGPRRGREEISKRRGVGLGFSERSVSSSLGGMVATHHLYHKPLPGPCQAGLGSGLEEPRIPERVTQIGWRRQLDRPERTLCTSSPWPWHM